MARPTISGLVGRLDPAITRLVAGILSVAILGWAALRVNEHRDATERAKREAESALASIASLRSRYEPAVAAESLAWRRIWLQLQGLGVVGDARVAITRQVADAAEEAGLRDVRVLIGPPDTTGSEARLSTDGVRRKPAPFSLLVEGKGGMRSGIAFLGRLPPSVAPTRIRLGRDDATGRHSISLAVYELTFTNGPPPPALTSSVEPGGAGRVRNDRPGG